MQAEIKRFGCFLLAVVAMCLVIACPAWHAIWQNSFGVPAHAQEYRNATNALFELDATTIGTSSTVLDASDPVILSPSGGCLSVSIYNAGTGTLSGFTVERQNHPAAAWHAILQDTDFDSTNDLLLMSSVTGPHELATGQWAFFDMRCRAAYALRFRANTASGTATVEVYGSFSGG